MIEPTGYAQVVKSILKAEKVIKDQRISQISVPESAGETLCGDVIQLLADGEPKSKVPDFRLVRDAVYVPVDSIAIKHGSTYHDFWIKDGEITPGKETKMDGLYFVATGDLDTNFVYFAHPEFIQKVEGHQR